jgi:hypothetical protein
MYQMLVFMTPFNFITNEDISIEGPKMESLNKYIIDVVTNELVTIDEKTNEEKVTYHIHKVTKDSMIVSQIE